MTDALSVTKAEDTTSDLIERTTRSGAKVRTSITLDPELLDRVKAESTRLAQELGRRDSVSSFIENLVRAHLDGETK
jgi:hypothetical protein